MQKPVVKKSNNTSRLVRLQQGMEQIKLIDAIVEKIVGPLRKEKQDHATRVRELLLDEGVAPDLLQKVVSIEVDPEMGEIRYILKPEPPKAPPVEPEDLTADEPKPTPAAKKPVRKKAAKKPTRKR